MKIPSRNLICTLQPGGIHPFLYYPNSSKERPYKPVPSKSDRRLLIGSKYFTKCDINKYEQIPFLKMTIKDFLIENHKK